METLKHLAMRCTLLRTSHDTPRLVGDPAGLPIAVDHMGEDALQPLIVTVPLS